MFRLFIIITLINLFLGCKTSKNNKTVVCNNDSTQLEKAMSKTLREYHKNH